MDGFVKMERSSIRDKSVSIRPSWKHFPSSRQFSHPELNATTSPIMNSVGDFKSASATAEAKFSNSAKTVR